MSSFLKLPSSMSESRRDLPGRNFSSTVRFCSASK